MGTYIPYTEEQKLLAASVNLERFLEVRGEKLIRSGKEKRLASDKSITIDGCEWFDHSCELGGNAISFVQAHYSLTFQEAMNLLLDSQHITIPDAARKGEKEEKPRKPFELPPHNEDIRRVYRYLTEKRLLPTEVLDYFVKTGKLYESRETMEGYDYTFHNAIFVGYDVDGKPRHAHKHGVSLHKKNFKGNLPGIDPTYGFSHIGTSDRLYVFEAPIDMLSFLALYPQNWQQHSYVCLCGVAKHALLRTLEDYCHLQRVVLCLDHDEAGIETTGRLTEELQEQGYRETATILPRNKDWNEDLRAAHGFTPVPAEEHPQIVLFSQNMLLFGQLLAKEPAAALSADILAQETRKIHSYLQAGEYAKARTQAWDASLLWAREYMRLKDTGETRASLCERLQASFAPHRNRRNSKCQARDTAALSQQYVRRAIPTAEDALELCLRCQMLVVRTKLDEQKMLEKQQRQEMLQCSSLQ